MSPRAKATVTPIRGPRQPAESPSGSHRIGTSGTETLCLEVPVRALGSRAITAVNDEILKGESFEEETTTMVVFARGAVIRLAASVAPGHDLLLVNKQTNKYVHCRITNVRTSPDVNSYVDVEFTHAFPDFWGISFPKEAVKAAAAAAAFPPPMPSSPMPGPYAEARPAVPEEPPPAAHAAATAFAAAAVAAPQPERALAIQPCASEVFPEVDSPAVADSIFLPKPTPAVPLGEPVLAPAEPEPAAEPVLVSPAEMKWEAISVREPRAKHVRIAALVAAGVFTLALGYRFLFPEQPPLPTAVETVSTLNSDGLQSGTAAASVAATPVPVTKSQNPVRTEASQPAGPSAADPPGSASTVNDVPPEVTPIATPSRLVVLVSKMSMPVHVLAGARHEAPDFNGTAAGAPSAADPQPDGQTPGAAVGLLATTGPEPPPPAEPETAQETGAEPADSVLPARLVASVQPAYPAVAMRARIEGDVVVEARIDASGNVIGTKVISGPLMLREAAANALAKWKFQPARLRGQPAPSTTIVTLRFTLH